MLQGRFDYSRKGRPYVDAITLFPRFKRARRVSFLVDTGADNTTISPIDALLLGVRYAELDLRRARPASGVGGSSLIFREPSIILFLDQTSNVMFTYRMKIGIIEDRQEARGLPSLLGRDILDRWEMTYCPTAGRLAFEVLSADDQLASPLTQLS